MSTSMETTSSIVGCGYHQGLTSKEKTLSDIMSMLRDDDINIIRINGEAGEGKNILAEKASMLATEHMLIDVILIVVISQCIDTSLIDTKLPKYSSIILSSHETRKERAKCLNDRLEDLRYKYGHKILVILSDVEEKLDLHDIQIPSGCKLVLTSREKNMCEEMGVKIENVVEVGHLTASETHDLFLNQLGATIDLKDSKLILEKMFKSCRLMPLSIVILANLLRNQRPHDWDSIAQSLEKFSNEENAGMSSEIYIVVKLSYSFILEEEKRLLFLICCLSPSATRVHISNLLIYGIGLGLFEHLTSLAEAIDQVYRWVDELVSSSLFLKVDSKTGLVWIHDVVREAGKLLASTVTGKRLFYAGAISSRHEEQTNEQYTAIAMMPDSDCGDLNGWDFPRLELLILSYTYVNKLSDDYFIRMQNLKVLDLSNSIINSLPSSIIMLINLQTLLLDYSRIGVSDIHQICSLTSLQLLSLKGCDITTLPKEIGNLDKLKFLDLTDCQQLSTIPPDVLRCFTRLEGLLMKNSFSRWGTEENTELTELKFLTFLRVLKISVETKLVDLYDADWNQTKKIYDGDLYSGLVFFDINIERNSIRSRTRRIHKQEKQHYSNISLKEGTLVSRNLRVVGMVAKRLKKGGWRSLVQKSENLFLTEIEGLTDIVPSLDEDGLNGLHALVVTRCVSMRYLINLSEGINQLAVFRTLRSLVLADMDGLEEIMFHWEPSEYLFPNLQEVVLSGLNRLKVLSLPIPVTSRLKVLRVSNCQSLEYIFTRASTMEVEEEVANTSAYEVKFSSLEELELFSIPQLRCFLNDRDSKVGETHKPFFSGKTEFPSLNVLRMHKLPCIMTIWELDTAQEFFIRFPNLQSLSLTEMNALRRVWSASSRYISIGSLKVIEILTCRSLSEIVSGSQVELKAISFPRLQTMKLQYLAELKYFCYGTPTLEFPALRELSLFLLHGMETIFGNPESSGALIQGKGLWNFRSCKEFTTAFPNLSVLYLGSIKQLRCLGRFEHDVNEGSQLISLASIKDISIEYCPELECLFSSSDVTKTTHPKLHFHKGVSFPKLHRLSLRNLTSFRSLLPGRSSLQFPALKELIIEQLPSVDILIKVEKCTTKTGWEELTDSPPEVEDSKEDDVILLRSGDFDFPCLKLLSLRKMPCLKTVIDTIKQGKGFGGEIIDHQIVFAQLEEIRLENIPFLRTFCSTSNPMEFPSLSSLDISKCTYMESFSLSSTILTPKLSSIRHDEHYSTGPYKETLNEMIQGRRDIAQSNE